MNKLGHFRLRLKKQKNAKLQDPVSIDQGISGQEESVNLTSSLSEKLTVLRQTLGGSSDFIIREFVHPELKTAYAAICYIDGLIDQTQLNDLIVKIGHEDINGFMVKDPFRNVKKDLPTRDMGLALTTTELIQAILGGYSVVLLDGIKEAFTVSLPGGMRRAIEEPSSQTVIRGPKEGFTEDISTNISLLRRRIRSADLRFEDRFIGSLTQTRVSVAYIQGIANPDVVKEVFARLDAIQTDSILESGYIEEFIQDVSFTPFPTVMNTERPDSVAGNLLEGLVAVLVDGTPFVLLLPVTFFKFFLSSEDYYQRYDISSFLRLIRLFSFISALLLPSIYIAVTTFQQEMIPTTLLISLAAQREGTPLPALLEALIMELTFEVIREAGVRMPRVVGPAISIVGALVLGQAAVQAGLVSAAMVIIVSFTAISSFVIPTFSMSAAARLVRFALMLLAGSFGLFGILAGIIPLFIHLVSLSSFGVPYFLPVAPLSMSNLKDVFIRVPWPFMKTRPAYISMQNKMRQPSAGKEGRKEK